MGKPKHERRAKRNIPEVRYNRQGLRLCSFCHRTLPVGAEDLNERMCVFHRRQWGEVKVLRELMKETGFDENSGARTANTSDRHKTGEDLSEIPKKAAELVGADVESETESQTADNTVQETAGDQSSEELQVIMQEVEEVQRILQSMSVELEGLQRSVEQLHKSVRILKSEQAVSEAE